MLQDLCWSWLCFLATGVSFHSFFLILFLFCSTIATKCAYEVSKGWVQQLRSYIDFGRKWTDKGYRYEFSLFFLPSFFNLLYHSYEMHLQIFEGLGAAVTELH